MWDLKEEFGLYYVIVSYTRTIFFKFQANTNKHIFSDALIDTF